MATNVTSVGPLEATLKHPFVFGVRALFYVVSPAESSFASVKEVPDYVNGAAPYFLMFIALEMIILSIQKKPLPRFSDAFSSIAAGIIMTLPLIVVRSIEMSAYIWVHENYVLYQLPWNSVWTWVLCLLGTDLGYYWVHRFAHEINFMWAGHQVHHSSEDYNLTTALRQSVLQRYSSWVFYLPMALFVPPQVFMVHVQFNLLYQFWIHTELIDNIGHLEYILNTPSHHRVHHGRNRYCIDKNYAGVLIIWDRMFGTFVPEGEKIAYGLVHPLSSWDCIYTQLCHWKWILSCMWERSGLVNKLNTLIKGPGWEPGKPRLGLIEDIPDIRAPQPKYNKSILLWASLYAWVHLGMTLVGQQILNELKSDVAPVVVVLFILFLLWTLTNQGYLFEHKWFAPPLEVLRCLVYLAVDSYICGGQNSVCSALMYIPRVINIASAVTWTIYCAKSYSFKRSKVE